MYNSHGRLQNRGQILRHTKQGFEPQSKQLFFMETRLCVKITMEVAQARHELAEVFLGDERRNCPPPVQQFEELAVVAKLQHQQVYLLQT